MSNEVRDLKGKAIGRNEISVADFDVGQNKTGMPTFPQTFGEYMIRWLCCIDAQNALYLCILEVKTAKNLGAACWASWRKNNNLL